MSEYKDLIERLRGKPPTNSTLDRYEAADAIEAQAKRIEELEAALKPFAEITQQQNFKDYQYNQDDCVMTAGVWGFKPDFTFKLGDIRNARKALEGK